MIDFKQNNTHILSFWKASITSLKPYYNQVSSRTFRTSSFSKFCVDILLDSEDNNLQNHIRNLAIETFDEIEEKLYQDLKILNKRKVNEESLLELSFTNNADINFVNGSKYMSLDFRKGITLYIDSGYRLTHIHIRYNLDVKELKFMNFDTDKFIPFINKNSIDLFETEIEKINLDTLSKYYLNYSGIYSLQEPILFDKRFITYWNSYLKLGDELFFFRAIKFDNPFNIKNTKTQEDYIELLKEEGLWLGSRIDKLCERNGKVKDLINAKKIDGKKNSSGYWVTDVYQFLKYLEQSNHSSNQYLLDKFLANHFSL